MRAVVFCELATNWCTLESRSPEETTVLTDAFDCVQLRAGRAAPVLSREKDVEADRERVQVGGRDIGENEVGACRRWPMEDDLASLGGARGSAVEGWRAIFVVIRRQVSRKGVSSSSLCHPISWRKTGYRGRRTCRSNQNP